MVLGGLLVVPRGLSDAMAGRPASFATAPPDTLEVAARARAIVMETERRLGFEPTDREFDKLGYDIESRVPATGTLRFIEVKGRRSDAETVTVTRNEILYSLNKPDDFILAIVEFRDDDTHRVHYVRQPFQREPDFDAASVNYTLKDLAGQGGGAAIGARRLPGAKSLREWRALASTLDAGATGCGLNRYSCGTTVCFATLSWRTCRPWRLLSARTGRASRRSSTP